MVLPALMDHRQVDVLLRIRLHIRDDDVQSILHQQLQGVLEVAMHDQVLQLLAMVLATGLPVSCHSSSSLHLLAVRRDSEKHCPASRPGFEALALSA